MIDNIIKTIEKYKIIANGDSILAGVSGGPDSVCLLHILSSLREDMNIKVFAVHVNHMLRGAESDEDEKYVKDLCAKLSIPLKTEHIDIKKSAKERGLSLEEAGREERYRLFGSMADNIGADKIAVAHNKNDQAETILMNIIRGTGLDGLKGMDYIRGRIIRPLLDIKREEIENYCNVHRLNPRIDSSNLETVYTRNKIRLEVIPYINKLFDADIVHSISKMSELIKSDSDFIEQNMEELYNKAVKKIDDGEITLNLSVLSRYHMAAKRRVIRNSIKEVKGNIKGIENIHIENINDLIEGGKVGSELHLPGGIRVKKSYEILTVYLFKHRAPALDFDERINIPGTTVIKELKSVIEAWLIDIEDVKGCKTFQNHSMTQFFDYNSLDEGINVRNRREGDKFKPLKSKGTKKLKEYFIDCKIPREIRDQLPLIARDKEVVWVIGYKISDKFKVTENTKRVLKLSYKSTENN
ncbi:MAG: tRNA lysidine(34) synthetase TilS [Bacillota bacterium]